MRERERERERERKERERREEGGLRQDIAPKDTSPGAHSL
jgi:hypothetical protein